MKIFLHRGVYRCPADCDGLGKAALAVRCLLWPPTETNRSATALNEDQLLPRRSAVQLGSAAKDCGKATQGVTYDNTIQFRWRRREKHEEHPRQRREFPLNR